MDPGGPDSEPQLKWGGSRPASGNSAPETAFNGDPCLAFGKKTSIFGLKHAQNPGKGWKFRICFQC